MNFKELITKIDNEEVEFIQEKVMVQYDQSQQVPLAFKWREKHCEVLKLLHTYKSMEEHPQYIVLTYAGIYCLALESISPNKPPSKKRWMLKYKLIEEEIDDEKTDEPATGIKEHLLGRTDIARHQTSRMTLLPLELANLAYYHGHVCPELVVGYRAAILAREEMNIERKHAAQYFVLVENMSSGIEAVQLLTGCTIGNQNFFAYDLGKHVYYFGKAENGYSPVDMLRLSLINPVVDLNLDRELDGRILSGKADLAELSQYEDAVSNSVDKLLELSDGELFSRKTVSIYPPRFHGRVYYTKCSFCGEIVSMQKSIPCNKGLSCQICADKQSKQT